MDNSLIEEEENEKIRAEVEVKQEEVELLKNAELQVVQGRTSQESV